MIHPRYPLENHAIWQDMGMYNTLFLLGWNTYEPLYSPNAIIKPMLEKLFLEDTTNVLKHFSTELVKQFCFFEKAASRSNTL